MFKNDIIQDELTCYNYFRSNKITKREELRKSYETNPIKGINQSFAECMLSRYNECNKVREERIKNNKRTSSIVSINDLHIPNQDERALKLVFDFIVDEQPSELVLNGDIIDCYWQSNFSHSPDHTCFLQDEADMFYRIFGYLRKYIPNTKITYVLGNHEDRIEKRALENPAFFGVKSLDLKSLLKLDKLNINMEKSYYKVNNLTFFHGEKCSSRSSYTAKSEFEAHKMIDGISAHTHRVGLYAQTCDMNTTSWHESGCLCKPDPDYIKGPVNWQHGFCYVAIAPDGTTDITNKIIKNYKFYLGRWYE